EGTVIVNCRRKFQNGACPPMTPKKNRTTRPMKNLPQKMTLCHAFGGLCIFCGCNALLPNTSLRIHSLGYLRNSTKDDISRCHVLPKRCRIASSSRWVMCSEFIGPIFLCPTSGTVHFISGYPAIHIPLQRADGKATLLFKPIPYPATARSSEKPKLPF